VQNVCVYLQHYHMLLVLLDSKPELKHLNNLVLPYYASGWRKIGHYLGLEDGQLDNIDHDNYHRAEDCCSAVLEEWLQMDVTATWNKVIVAIDSPVVLLTTVTNQLREFYKNDKFANSAENWPFYQDDNFTSVALIHHKRKSATIIKAVSVANIMHQGKVAVNTIFDQPKPLATFPKYLTNCQTNNNLSELFSSLQLGKENIPTRILIEGAPGIGKTILSKQIAFEWATSKLLVEKQLLFLIILRDPYVQEIDTLDQFVCYAIKASTINNAVKAIVQYLEDTSGKHCIIVFDGYDELSEDKRIESFIEKIIKHKVLKLCTVVITSRQNASLDLRSDIEYRVEILGFTKEKRDEYISHCLKNDKDKIQKMREYLITNPFIDGLCYIPLNMTILICLMLESDTAELPRNQTEINDRFTVAAISRYLKREHNIEYDGGTLQQLPEEFKQQFEYLCQLAYVFLGMDKIVFDDNDIRKHCPNLVEKWSTLGLLNVVNYRGFHKTTPRASYNFLHFSIQEFLAAYHIHSLNDSKEIKSLKNIFWNPRYLNASVMYVGLTKGNSFALKHFLSGHKFSFITKLFGSKSIASNTIQNKVKCLHLLQCFSEAGNDELMQQLGGTFNDTTIDLSENSLLPRDIHTLSFFLARSTTKIWEILNLANCYMGDNTFNVFCKTLSDFNEHKVVISAIDLSCNHLTCVSLKGIIDLIYCFSVKHLLIHSNSIDKEAFDDVLFSVGIERQVDIVLKVDNCNHYFINHLFEEENCAALEIKSDSPYNVHFWKTNIHLSHLGSLFTSNIIKIASLNVYSKYPQDKDVIDVIEKLRQFNSVTYALQSEHRLHVCNTGMVKTIQAVNEFLAHHKTLQSDENIVKKNWKIIILHCFVHDINPIVKKLKSCFHEEHKVYLETLTISQCQNVSANVVLEILKYCVLKNFVLAECSIPHSKLFGAILSEISTKSQLLNFKHGIPLILFNKDYLDHTEDKASTQSLLCSTKYMYVVNCNLDDSLDEIANFCNDKSNKFSLVLSNASLKEDNLERVLFLIENPHVNISIFENEIEDEMGLMLFKRFKDFAVDNHTCVLNSNSILMAYGATEKQINEVFDCSRNIVSTTFLNCNLTELSMFKTVTDCWDTIDLSGSNIENDHIEKLSDLFSYHTKAVYIKHFNLSETFINPLPLIKLLQFCIIENLVVTLSNCMIDGDQFDSFIAALCSQYESGITFPNFMCGIPLVVTNTLKIDPHEVQLYVFLSASLSDAKILHQSMKKVWNHCSILSIVNQLPSKVYINTDQKIRRCVDMDYSAKSSVLKVKFAGAEITNETIQSTILFLVNALLFQCTVKAVHIKTEDCVDSMPCKILFNDKSLLQDVEEVDLRSIQISESCVDSFVESLQCCGIKRVLIYDCDILETFTRSIFAANVRFASEIYCSIINSDAYGQHIDTYILNCAARIDLNEVLNDVQDIEFTLSHNFHIYNCCREANSLNDIVSLLYTEKFVNNMFIYEVNISDEWITKIINYSNWLWHHIRYVLTSQTMIYATGANTYEVLEAIKCTSSVTSTTQNEAAEQATYMNTSSESKYLTNTSRSWLYVCLTSCSLTDEDLSRLQTYFTGASIKILNLSYNDKLTVLAVVRFILNCNNVQNLYFNKEYNKFHLTEILSSLLPNAIAKSLEIEISFRYSAVFVLCESYLCLDDFMVTASTTTNPVYFLLVKCGFHEQKIDFIVQQFSLIQNLSSIHLHYANLQCRHLLNVIEKLLHIELFILEDDFLFINNISDCNYEHEKSLFTGVGVKAEIVWLDKSDETVFIFSQMKLIKYAIRMIKVLNRVKLLHSFNIYNVYVTEHLAEDIRTVLTNVFLKSIKMVNINISDRNMLLTLENLQNTKLMECLVINSVSIVNYCRDKLSTIITANKQLSHLDISNCNLKESTIITIAEAIEHINKSLKYLNLSQNIISNVAADHLAFSFRKAHSLSHIDLSNTKLQAQGIISIAQSLKDNNELEGFCINNCDIPNKAIGDITSCILKGSSLRCLEMSNCKLEDTSILRITEALIDISSLEILNFSKNKITDVAANNLSLMITKNRYIECLKLSMNSLQEKSVIKLLSSCKVLYKLNCVDFDFSHFSAPVSEDSYHIYLSIDDVIHSIKVVDDNDEDDLYTYIEAMNDIKQIKHITVSNCNNVGMFSALVLLSSLEHLDVNSSAIPFTAISTTIANNVQLKHINLSNCSLQDHMFLEIAKAMSLLMLLRYLNVSGIKINETSASFLAGAIVKNPAIYHLDISKCQLQHYGLLKIIRNFKYLKYLSYLDVSYNCFTVEAAHELSNILSYCMDMEHVSLSHCNLYEQSFLFIAKSLANLTTLRHINLSANVVNFKIASAMHDCISSNHNLEYFDISNCFISENDVQTITASLKLLTSLRKLNISSIKLNFTAVNDLADLISDNPNLEYLNISNCEAHEDDVLKILMHGLLHTYTLEYLNLQSVIHIDQVSKEMCKNVILALVTIVNNNKSLETFNLSNWELSASELRHVLQALSGLSSLLHFNISHNDVAFHNDAAGEIAFVIKNNKSLEVLNFSNCSMRGDSISTVATALAQCTQLASVNLSNNIITKEATSKIALGLCNSATLEHINLSGCSLEFPQFFSTLNSSVTFHFKLKQINLSSNIIDYNASLDLATFLEVGRLVECLDLSNCFSTVNKEEEDSLFYILTALKNSNYLKQLDLESDKFSERATRALYNVTCVNQKLEYLNLKQCNVSESLLGDIISQCRVLKFLDISHNAVTDETADVLSSAIFGSNCLQYLNVNDCILQEDATDIITNAFMHDTQLHFTVAEEDIKHTKQIDGIVLSNLNVSILQLIIEDYNALTEHLGLNIVKPIYYFNLASHCISEKMNEFILSAFSTLNIEYFDVSGCDLRDYTCYLLMKAIKHRSSLRYLLFKSSTIPDEGLNNIVAMMYNNSKLTHVDLSDCELSASQVSNIAKGLRTLNNLISLNISKNSVNNEAIDDIASVITRNKTLQDLNISNCGIDDVGIQSIFKALSTITSLLSLDFSNNHVGESSAGHIASVLLSNASLYYLNFMNCFVENLSPIFDGPKMQAIKHLSLENNVIDDCAAEFLKSAFIDNTKIEYLNLSQCSLTEAGMISILSALEAFNSLQSLNLSLNDFTKMNSDRVSYVMQANCNLTRLELADCKLSPTNLVDYINYAVGDTSLIQFIDFSYNCYSFDAANLHSPKTHCVQAEVTALSRNKTFKHLNLSHCKLSNVTMHEIFLALNKCRSLTYLNLQSCTVTGEILLGPVTTNNQDLEYLNFSDCKLQQRDIITISECLTKAHSFSYLLLSCNEINNAAAKELASSISTNLSLKQLILSNCKLQERELLLIADALQWISSLQHLDLSYCIISDAVAAAIATALSHNTSLEYLNMSNCTWSNNGVTIIHKQFDLEKFPNLREVDFSNCD